MSFITCPRCDAVQTQPAATTCGSCGHALDAATPLARETKAELYAEVSRVAREDAWHEHVPENRFVERQHGALRTAIGLVAATLIVLVPAATILNRAANARFDQGGENSGLIGSLLLTATGICLLLGLGAFYLAYRIVRSFRAYGRAPIERCPVLVISKRCVTLDKAGRKESRFVTLEFMNGEQREYRTDKPAFEFATERRAGLAFLRANHLLDLKLLPA